MNLYDTYTYQEIMQQQTFWPEAVQAADVKEKFKALVSEKKKKGNLKIYFSGAGTSAYVGDILSRMLKTSGDISFHAAATTDIVTEPEEYFKDGDNIILFSFARSGNSPETKGTVTLADQLSADISHVFVTNNKDGYLARYEGEAVKIILPEETNDRALAMTSSFSTMLIAAASLFDTELSRSFTDNLKEIFSKVETFAAEVLKDDFKKIFYVGTGVNSEMTRETSLKMNELTGGRIDVSRETTLGFRHGPKAALTEGALFIQLYSNTDQSYIHQYERDITSEVTAFNHYYKAIITPSKSLLPGDLNENCRVLETGTEYSRFELSLVYLLFGQLLACMKSHQLSINPDEPSPDGFINRVVEGVTLYDYES